MPAAADVIRGTVIMYVLPIAIRNKKWSLWYPLGALIQGDALENIPLDEQHLLGIQGLS